MQEGVTTGADEVKDVLDERVFVLVRHARDVVHDIAGVVTDEELSTSRFEVGVGREHGRTLNEAVVGGSRVRMCSRASVVQSREDARRTALLDKVADNLVVEELDWIPLDLFPNIFFLLRLQCQFYENLLQLLVDVVDAELLK